MQYEDKSNYCNSNNKLEQGFWHLDLYRLRRDITRLLTLSSYVHRKHNISFVKIVTKWK